MSLWFVTGIAADVSAQQRGGGAGAPPAGPPPTPQASAPIDITGYWVSIVNEDWRWRMITPPVGDTASVPLNPEGAKIAKSWDPKTDGSCLAYGAAGLMRIPTRLNITWENENTLKIETDAGQQTRRLLFDKATATPGPRSLQGLSIAEWERPGGRGGGGRGGGGGGGGRAGGGGGGDGAAPAPAADAGRAGGRGAGRGPGAQVGNLKVVTTNLSGGWLRKNGIPYSELATMTEFFDRFAVGSDQWLVVTTIVTDPKYLNQDFITSTHFKKEADGAKKWDPTPCKPVS